MKKSNAPAGAPSQRQLRVGELVRHALVEVFQREDLYDPALKGVLVTVPEVRMSADLKLGTAFVMPLGGKDGTAVVAALERNKRQIRGYLAPRLDLRSMPEIRFRLDTSFDRGAAMDASLAAPDVARDTRRPPEEDAS
jgi:ribosome-binding factor A